MTVSTRWGGACPARRPRFALGMFQASRAGEFAVTGSALGEVIGHEPRSARSYLAAATAR